MIHLSLGVTNARNVKYSTIEKILKVAVTAEA